MPDYFQGWDSRLLLLNIWAIKFRGIVEELSYDLVKLITWVSQKLKAGFILIQKNDNKFPTYQRTLQTCHFDFCFCCGFLRWLPQIIISSAIVTYEMSKQNKHMSQHLVFLVGRVRAKRHNDKTWTMRFSQMLKNVII